MIGTFFIRYKCVNDGLDVGYDVRSVGCARLPSSALLAPQVPNVITTR